MKLPISILLLLFCAGCAKDAEPTSTSQLEVKIPNIRLRDPEFAIDGRVDNTVHATTGQVLRVNGQFRLEDPSQTPTPLVIKIKRAGARAGGGYGLTVLKEHDVVTFDSEITAPTEPGTYLLEVVEGQTTIANRSLVLSPP